MLWDANDAEGRTALQVAAQTPLQAPPVALGEGFDAGWESALAEEQTVSRARLETLAWQQLVGDAVEKSGAPIGNPGRALGMGDPIDWAADALSEAVSGKPWMYSARGRYEAAKADTRARLSELGLPVPTDQDIHDRMQAIADEKQARLREVQAGGGAGAFGAFAGSMAGVMTDPPNVASLALGAPAGIGVLRAMAVEAGVNMAVEASNQVSVSALKQSLGREYGVGDAAAAVAMAGGGAAALTAVGHGAAAAWRGWRKVRELKPELAEIPEARAGETYAARAAMAEETAPLPDVGGEEMHAAALDAAEAALNGGDPFLVPEYAAQVRRDIGDLVAGVAADGAKGAELERVVYGRVLREEIPRLARGGLDAEKLATAPRIIQADAVSHALTKHAGDPLPLRPEDIERVPDVVREGEFVEVTTTNSGKPGIVRREEVDGSWLYVVEEVIGDKQHSLWFKTAYRTPKGKGRPEGRPSGARFSRSMPMPEADVRNVGDGPATQNIAPPGGEINRGAPDFRPLPSALRAPGDGRKPVSLLEFLRRQGGLRDEGGELSAMDLGKRRPGLVSKRGKPLDMAREAAAEAGYIPPEATLNDFVDAVRREAGGAPVYLAEDVNAVAAWNGYEGAVREAADLLGGTDAARGLSDADYAHALDVARGHRAWEAGPGKTAPISDVEAAALVDAARTEGRAIEAVVDDYAEARAALLDYARARAEADAPIPFDMDAEMPRAEAIAADEAGRWAEASDALATDPEMTIPWPWEEGNPDARFTLRDAFALTDEWDRDAAEAMACAALGAVA